MEKISTNLALDTSVCEKSSITTTATTVVSISPSSSIRHTDSHSLFPQREKSPQDHTLDPTILTSQVDTKFSTVADLEAQNLNLPAHLASASKTGLLCNKTKFDPMWPNRQDLKQRKRALKRERAYCACWAGMSKKKRGIISTIVIIVILGAGLSVGFGISKRVGGRVVNSQGTNTPLVRR